MGWWTLNASRDDCKDLTDVDREHIAALVREGYTSGVRNPGRQFAQFFMPMVSGAIPGLGGRRWKCWNG